MLLTSRRQLRASAGPGLTRDHFVKTLQQSTLTVFLSASAR